jgi:hypothetical protein
MTDDTTELEDADELEDDIEEAVAVFAAPDEMTAQIVRSALEAEGIPAAIGEQVTSALAPGLSVGEGFWGEICVPASLADQARAIIASLEEGSGRVSEEELAEAAAQFPSPEAT